MTFATLSAVRSQGERQIQGSTRVDIVARGPLIDVRKSARRNRERTLESDRAPQIVVQGWLS